MRVIYFLETKLSKKSRKELKEEIVKDLESIILVGVQTRIDNSIESAKLGPVIPPEESASVPELEKTFLARMDDTDLATTELTERVDKLAQNLTKLNENSESTAKSIHDWQQWKDSGVMSSKEDWLLGLWGLSVLQVRYGKYLSYLPDVFLVLLIGIASINW